MRRIAHFTAQIALAACAESTTDPTFAPFLSNEVVPGIAVTLTVAPSQSARGDSLELIATARNSTNERIQIGIQCGPAMDVLLRGPGDFAASALALMIGPNGAFTCELSDRHFAPANGSQQVRIRFAAPQRVGAYTAVAGLRRSEGLSNLSAPAAFTVR